MKGMFGEQSRGVAVVTGASRGLALACARRFLDEDWNVIGIDIAPVSDELTRYVAENRYLPVEADVTDPDAIATAFQRISESSVAPMALVNAAGMYPATHFGNSTREDFRRIFELNVWGTINTSQQFCKVTKSGSSIVNIASRDIYSPPLNQYLYSASKASIVNLTTGTAQALLDRGIRVNAVSPPRIATEALKAIYGTMPEDTVAPELIAAVVWELAAGKNMRGLNGQVVRIPAQGEIDF